MKTSPSSLIKTLTGICGLVLLIQTAQAQFTFPVYEPFSEYPDGERISKTSTASPNSDTNWGLVTGAGNSGSTSTSPLVNATNALFYPGLLGDPGNPPRGILAQTGVGRTACAPFTTQTNGTIYLSFLLNLETLPLGGDRPIIGLNGTNNGTPNTGSGAAVWVTPTGQLKVSKNTTTAAATNVTSPLVLSNTYLVVLSYSFLPTPDPVSIWLNPTALGDNNNVPPPTISSTNNADSTTIASMCLYAGTGFPVMTNLEDELRVDNNWAGVTPTSPWSGGTYAVGGGGTGCQGTAFDVTLANSDVGVTYLLYTNGVASSVTASGTGALLHFGLQNVSGNYTVLATNTTLSQVRWMSGSANISVAVPVAITTQPVDATVVLGSTAVYTVASTGTSLSYQWRRNGVNLTDTNNISGSSTPTLVISPVGPGDLATAANGYDVHINDACANVTNSVRAALNSKTASNLSWAGAPTNIWDIDTTTNWSADGVTQTFYFNGDNVQFDDTPGTFGGSFTVFMSTVNLFPGSIRVANDSPYIFNGPGGMNGPASLTMVGPSSLTVSNANGYTGGTTIIGSSAILQNIEAFGTGTITLSNATLELGKLGYSAASAPTNNINVTADSTIQYDGTGTQAAVLLGALTGPAGVNILLNESAGVQTVPPRVRLYSTNFTLNANLNLFQTSGQVATYNASGTQTYNGVISGAGSMIARNGGGTVIYNGSNTYVGPFQLATGTVGIGVDSVPDTNNPPALLSGPLGVGVLQLNVEGGGTSTGTLIASGGSHTLANPIVYVTTSNNILTFVLGGSNALTLSGTYNLSGQDGTTNTGQIISVTNTNTPATISGVIGDTSAIDGVTSLGCGILKIGAGTLVLTATNTYTGPTAITNGALQVDGLIGPGAVTVTGTGGVLSGVGTIIGSVEVQSGGTLAPGDSGIGTLNVSNSLTLDSGSTTSIEVNKGAGTSDLVSVVSNVVYAGTLFATNLSGTPNIGDSFTIFTAAAHSGGFSATNGTPGTGKLWSFNPGTGKLSVIAGSTVNTNRTPIVFSLGSGGNSLTLSWPLDHIGWRLQGQTNGVNKGISTNWVTVAGSTTTNQIVVPINPANGTVFFRLVYP